MTVNFYPLMDRIPFLILIPTVMALVALPAAIGFWLGRRGAGREGSKPDQTLGTIVGATLGLLAFMLAFTFGSAASRYETRRQLVMDEANAVATTYRRARLLPDPHRAEAQQLLREYVDLRLAAAADPTQLPTAIGRSEELQSQLWQHALAVAAKDSTSWTAAWFIESLTNVFELHARRIGAGMRNRVPTTVWLALGLIIVLSMSAMGYQAGLAGGWRVFPAIVLVVSFATVMSLIADLDRPQQGLITVSQAALTDVQKAMNKDMEASPTEVNEAAKGFNP